MADDFYFHRMNSTMEQNWSLEKGYSNSSFSAYPRRALTAGSQNGLTVSIGMIDKDFDYLCRGPAKAFKVIFEILV